MITIRDYTPDDRNACLAVFDSNTPQFFTPVERDEFLAFLEELPGPYFIADVDGKVLGCGGFAHGTDHGVCVLCWGMVHLDHHRHGIGKALLAYRLNQIGRAPTIRRVTINTSQHTRTFFEKFGFTVERIVRDGYGPSLDRCEMNLIVTPDSQKSSSGAIITA